MNFPRLASALYSLAGKVATPRQRRMMIPATQATPRLNIPRYTDPQSYANVGAYLAQFTPRDRQQLIGVICKNNFLVKQIAKMTLDPVVGFSGFTLSTPDELPTVNEIATQTQTFNRLDNRREQWALARSYFILGEVCLLLGQTSDQAWFVQRISPLLISQTILDPDNPYEVIAVALEPSYMNGEAHIFKTIVADERRLSQTAQALREQIPYSCLYAANFDDDEFEDASAWMLPSFLYKGMGDQWNTWLKKQRRGVSFFYAYLDLFNHLLDTLWGMLDKVRSGYRINYDFTVNTHEDDPERSAQAVRVWQQMIGVPESNQPFFHDHNVQMQPVSFPLSSDNINEVINTIMRLGGLSANISAHDMGNVNVNFATAKAMGNPTEYFQVSLQKDIEDIFYTLYDFVLRDATLPASERKFIEANRLPHSGVIVTSPEIGLKNLQAQATTFNTHVQSLTAMLQTGLWQPADIGAAGTTLAKQILEIDIAAKTADDLQAEQDAAQAQQQQATEPATQAYNENQPRDERGRWSAGGGGGGTATPSPQQTVDAWVRVSSMNDPTEFQQLHDAGVAWVEGQPNQQFENLYRETQQKWTQPEIEAYRGIVVPKNHPLSQALASGKIRNGQQLNIDGLRLNSWSENFATAGRFANPDGKEPGSVGIVIKSTIKKADVVASHRTQKGFFTNEQEIIAKTNTNRTITVVVSTETMNQAWKP